VPLTDTQVILPPTGSERRVVEQVCDTYTKLARKRKPDDLRYECVLIEACKKVCPYIVSQDEGDHPETCGSEVECFNMSNLVLVRELIIEFSIAVGPRTLRAAYGDAAVVQFRWNNRGLIEQGEYPGDCRSLRSRVFVL
jgi:hypothetical protein